ncbi:U3 small nucleolar RNA-associated protein 14 homolog A [Procambarus clarkii]|uniref:U3 small nucleolar RNA-associated protein 14 homolog A n=1 Tax=Procambarus clarkii TaxID=6728 RepID=UPI001E678B31|nr:U3 small nucleolar RNA-associated protein 14 homolog A-like [Procambarus clarkii]
MGKLNTTSVKLKNQKDEELFLAPTPDGEGSIDDEEEGDIQDEKSHARLLSDISKMSKKKKPEVRRDVRTSLGAGVCMVDTSDIVKKLGSYSLSKSSQKIKSLAKPHEKTVLRRAKRAAGFENVAMEVNKWGKVVHLRRQADHLSFPLEKADLRFKVLEKVEPVKLRSPLEQEVYSLLHGAKLIEKKTETEEERAKKRALSLQQVQERNREMWRQRELKRRYERKSMMQNKSKSRKHHRLLRRERLKKQKAELEQLEKTDPEAVLEKLEELERARVEERMSLRHKKSKWAHLQGFRATKDENAMAALKENQRMHRELITKVVTNAEDEDDQEVEEALKEREKAIEEGTYDPMNPWTNNLNKASSQLAQNKNNEDESFSKFKQFWEEVNNRKLAEKKIQEHLDKGREVGQDEMMDEQEKEEVENEQVEVEEEEMKENIKSKVEQSKDNVRKRKVKNKRRRKGKLVPDVTSITEEQNKIETTLQENSEDENRSNDLISIDEMFDEAEIGIKNKVKRKLQKLGMSTESGEAWKKVKRRRQDKRVTQVAPVSIEEFDFSSKNDKDNIDEKLERVKAFEDGDSIQEGSTDRIQQAADTLRKGMEVQESGTTAGKTIPSASKKGDVDPTKFLQVDARKLATAIPDNVASGEGLDDDDSEEDEDAEDVIREAFADDYLIEEFSSEKAAARERDRPKLMSLALPGWGDWTGPNIKMSKKKIRKFRIQTPRAPPRKDLTIGNVIYNEKADVHDNLRKAMVSDLPYPFKSVKDFEASVRTPVGRMFVPEAVHKKLTAPPLVTKMGSVIEPMTEDVLLRHKQRGQSVGENPKKSKKKKVNKMEKRNEVVKIVNRKYSYTKRGRKDKKILKTC